MARWADQLFQRLTGADPNINREISDEAARKQPSNAWRYFGANALGKLADELSSARLVLPWLFGALAVPVGLVGLLVPLREAGVLLPQTGVAAYGQRFTRRKSLWIAGACISAISLLLIAATAQLARGLSAGLILLSLLTLYSLGRGICSVSAKEVLGKILAKSVRGKLMGWSSALSGLLLLAIGLWFSVPQERLGLEMITLLLCMSASAWGVAILLFTQIEEPPQRADEALSITQQLADLWQILRHDSQLQGFIWVRSLLLSTALAQPYVVLLVQQQEGDSIYLLGYLLLLSALVSAIASPIWGYMSDIDSPRQMAIAAFICALVALAVGSASLAGASPGFWPLAVAYALLTLAHTGVRLGRKVYLLDMSDSDNRGAYTALSNTVIGLVLLLLGVLGILSQGIGIASTLLLLGLLALVAAWRSLHLPTVNAH